MPTRPSSASEFFHRIVDAPDPVAALRELYTAPEPTFETEWLDFKGVEKLPDGDIPKIWSQALSGFANTAGGVLVWGIDARRDAAGVDAARAESLAPNAAKLHSRLMQLHHGATDPPVLGIDVRSFDVGGGAGFVVCLIPESAARPHRAENAPNKPYYIRVGDNFVLPNPSFLRALFYPQTRSRLWAEVATSYKLQLASDGHVADLGIEARLHNSGAATARELYVVLQVLGEYPFEVMTGVGPDWLTGRNPQGKAAFEAKRPLHVGLVSTLFSMSTRLDANPFFRGDRLRVQDVGDIDFRLVIYAADQEPVLQSFRFARDEWMSGVTKRGEFQSESYGG